MRALLAQHRDPDHQGALLAELPATARPAFAAAFFAQLRALAESNPHRYPRPRQRLRAALDRPSADWAPLGEQLVGSLDRYVRYHLLARWYTEAADLGQHMDRLLLKLAVVRAWVARRDPALSPEDALVEAAYAVDRLVEHDVWIFSARAALRQVGGSYFDQLGDLIRVA